MITLETQAFAKLNLTLDVLHKREDGYHELESVMQQITLCDDLEIDLETGEDWKLECDMEGISTGSDNLAWKAAGVFYKALGKDPQGISIRIHKRIPAGAGLGGGSADAAAVLKALNEHEGSPFTGEELRKLGEKLGSDVPFCVRGGTMLATGRGETLELLPVMPRCFYCIAMPDFTVSTPELFAKWDAAAEKTHAPADVLKAALQKADLLKAGGSVQNALEPLVAAEHPEIAELRSAMLDAGALGVSMTGSGSAVFGVFDAFDMAAVASMTLMEKGYRTYISTNQE